MDGRTKVIVGSVNGRWKMLKHLLTRMDILENKIKSPEYNVITIGNFFNLQNGDAIKESVIASEWINCYLYGYQEFYALNDDRYYNDDAMRILRFMIHEGKYCMATNVGKWLVTHAGLSNHWKESLESFFGSRIQKDDAESLATAISGTYDNSTRAQWSELFHGGSKHDYPSSPNPGIIKISDEEICSDYHKDYNLHQIIGHTSRFDQAKMLMNNRLISLGTHKNALTAISTDDNGASFKKHTILYANKTYHYQSDYLN